MLRDGALERGINRSGARAFSLAWLALLLMALGLLLWGGASLLIGGRAREDTRLWGVFAIAIVVGVSLLIFVAGPRLATIPQWAKVLAGIGMIATAVVGLVVGNVVAALVIAVGTLFGVTVIALMGG